jgi:hypothetical protein
MPVFRRKKKPRQPTNLQITDVQASLQTCLDKIAALERERETDIQRMGAMQAEIDHLRALMNRT